MVLKTSENSKISYVCTLFSPDPNIYVTHHISDLFAGWPSRLGLQNMPKESLQRSKTPQTSVLWPSRLGLQNTPKQSLQRSKTPQTSVLWPSRLGLQNTPTTSLHWDQSPQTNVLWPSQLGLQNTTLSLQRSKTLLKSVLDMTRNTRMVRLH